MTAQWEYMLVIWMDEFRYKEREVPDYTKGGTKKEFFDRRWEHTLYVMRPGSRDIDRRISYSSEDARMVDGWVFGAIELFNELGREGWELVSEVPRGAAIRSELNGYIDASEPIKAAYWFKRLV